MEGSTNIFSLAGKNIIITGASSGIGHACTKAADKIGASLVLLDFDAKGLQETLRQTLNADCHQTVVLDLTDYSAVEDVFKEHKEKNKKFDGLVNCAGISTTTPLSRTNPDKIQRFIDINVSAGVNLSRLLSQKHFLSESGASIVFIASVMGVVGEVGKTLYSITKGALIAASRSMALELATKKIRVNCISPGVVETPLSKNAIYSKNEESLKRITEKHPLGLGNPEDVANAVTFLLSDASRWITGTNFIVDGGYTAR